MFKLRVRWFSVHGGFLFAKMIVRAGFVDLWKCVERIDCPTSE